MTALAVEPLALVPPAFHTGPPADFTRGREVSDFSDALGFVLDPEQRLALDVMYAATGPGVSFTTMQPRWAAMEMGLIAPRQNLKALAWDTPILTANRGWVANADIEVGDSVYHPGGHAVSVVGASDVKLGSRCYRVTTTDGRSVVADAGHLWTVEDKRSRVAGRPTLRTLTTEQLLAEGLSRYASGGRTTVTDGKRYAVNEYRFTLPRQEPIKSDDVDLPIDPYLFGAWLGDGSSASAALTCHEDDVEHWCDTVRASGFIPTARRDRTAWTVGITTHQGVGRHSRSFAGKLRALGVLGAKSVPDIFLTAGTYQRLALLQGLLDTDGTVAKRRGQVTFTGMNKSLADAVLYLSRSLGWRSNIRTQQAILNGKDCGAAYQVLFTPTAEDDFCPFRLPRKAERVKARDGRAGRFAVSIKSVEPVDSVPVRCIKVDAPDGLYLAGRDLIATHNTGVLKPSVLADCLILGAPAVVWSAHRRKTVMRSFKDIEKLIEANAWVSRYVRHIHRSMGNEAIEFTNGSRIDFVVRSEANFRGESNAKIVVDEGLYFTAAQRQAIQPTMAAVPNPLIVVASSPGLEESEELRAIRDRGRKGDPTLAYLEWASTKRCASKRCRHELDTPGCVADDEAEWAAANPALHRRISVEFLRATRRSMVTRPEKFLIEHMGHWPDGGKSGVISVIRWSACAAEDSIVDAVAVAVDVSLDRSMSWIAVCGATADGTPQVEIADSRPGTDWVPEVVAEVLEDFDVLAVGARTRGAVTSLLPSLRATCDEAGVPFKKVTTGDSGGMCGLIYDRVRDQRLRHRGDVRLLSALKDARKHKIADAWEWERENVDTDAAPLVAVTVALGLWDELREAATGYDAADSFY